MITLGVWGLKGTHEESQWSVGNVLFFGVGGGDLAVHFMMVR